MNKSSSIEQFQFYYTPTLVYLGSIGNMLSVYIFLTPKLRKLTSSYYLSALAISDTIFLITLFIVWLTMVDIDVFNQAGACQTIVYITSICSFLSVWFVVAFTVERFVAVHYPLLRHSICTTRRAKLVLSYLIIFAVVLFTPMLFFADTQILNDRSLCSVQPDYQELAAIFNFVDTVLTFIIPVGTIVLLNGCICRAIWKLDKTRKKITVKRTVILARDVRPIRHFEYTGTQTKVTKMLLVVSCTFLCFNLPSYVMRVLTYLIEFELVKEVNLELFMNVQHWCMQLFNTNFGVNFILYCIGGQNFRRAVKNSFYGKRRTTTTSILGSENRMNTSSLPRMAMTNRLKFSLSKSDIADNSVLTNNSENV